MVVVEAILPSSIHGNGLLINTQYSDCVYEQVREIHF